MTGGTLFEELGFLYVGPVDGHNLDHLLPILRNLRDAPRDGPILLHVVTEKGRGLFQVIVALGQWGQESLAAEGVQRMRLVDREHRQPVRKLEVRASDGRLLAPGETMMVRMELPPL